MVLLAVHICCFVPNLCHNSSGATVSGSSFYFLKNMAALLELALISHAMNFFVSKVGKPLSRLVFLSLHMFPLVSFFCPLLCIFSFYSFFRALSSFAWSSSAFLLFKYRLIACSDTLFLGMSHMQCRISIYCAACKKMSSSEWCVPPPPPSPSFRATHP